MVTSVVETNRNGIGGSGYMAPWVKALVTKPCDLSSISITHMVARENQLPQVAL